MQEQKTNQVRSRNEAFTERASTKIYLEQPSNDNPYIASAAFCHGYDLNELMAKRSFTDVFYLLFRGELPAPEETQILQQLMIALINPGPRHPATRAAMNAGIGKTEPAHILPIGAALLGGDHHGGGLVEDAMRFLRKQHNTDATACAVDHLQSSTSIPGFGAYYGGVDLLACKHAAQLAQLPGAGKALHWGNQLSGALAANGMGWLMPGVAAAVLSDLGFQPKAGVCLYQLMGAPGLVAHGLELANKPITAMPFVSDENYFIER
ncbi:citrate/2-methylcitrate synthase [Cellvibrio sp. OA-2007]|uniref:citrate/2-methylcitrate synthase n=1 Tax=Cellvibrio sp. OA-2007 TaxID=529823 RepID=UPI0007804CB7|nr:citrate/2-methylcitrate synthase [Cellvibrio sp. OA-2007]